ncbi:MAG: GtrA family protein [Patescibacteria group bacterium]|jgi:putative flippase GtrA
MPLINKLYFRFRHFFSDRFPKIYCFCDNRKSIVKFFIAGCFAGATDIVFLFLFHGLLKWELVLSTSLAFVLSFLVSFTLQKFWTFRNYDEKETVNQLFLYILNAFIGLNINGFLMHLLVVKFNIWYILSQIMVNLFLGFCNFLIYKFIIFRNTKNAVGCQ